jgi:type II secretory pathway predicted ATPase ExeA
MEHLLESTRIIARESDEKRIRYMSNDRWVGYPAAKRILDKMEDLLGHPTVLRMPNMLVVGEANNGKTSLVHRFFTKHKPAIVPGDTRLIAPVLYTLAPPQPDEKKFYNAILESLNAPYKVIDRAERKHQQVAHLFRHLGVRMLIIDEIHNILAGSMSRQRTFLNVIKNLTNELQIVIVAAGIEDAFHAVSSDIQLSTRFQPSVLPKWKHNEDYLRLLSSFEAILPLREPSYLAEDRDLALRILALSEGKLGEISNVLTLAAIKAIRGGKESIDRSTVNAIDYVIPSERKKMPTG